MNALQFPLATIRSYSCIASCFEPSCCLHEGSRKQCNNTAVYKAGHQDDSFNYCPFSVTSFHNCQNFEKNCGNTLCCECLRLYVGRSCVLLFWIFTKLLIHCLLHRLSEMGVHGNELNWFIKYLSNHLK